MMNITINDTIKAQCEGLQIEGMKSPKFTITETPQGSCSEATLGEAGVLTTRIYGKDEELVKLLYVDEITCECDNGIMFKGIIKEFSSPAEVSGAVDITMQLYRL